MNIFLYIIIFSSKILENALSTLRIIVVANGKKLLGAILQGVISLIWVYSTSLVVTNLLKDPLKIIAFTLGSLIGSYTGSLIEQKIAIGSNLLTIIIDKEKTKEIVNKLKNKGYKANILKSKNYNKLNNILMIMIKRKEKNIITKIIKSIDKNATIIVENAYTLDYLSK